MDIGRPGVAGRWSPAQLAVPVITDTPMCAELHTPTRTHTRFFEDLVEFLKKEIPSLPAFFLCGWVEGSITHPHLLGTYTCPVLC